MEHKYTPQDFEWLNELLVKMADGDTLGQNYIVNLESLDGYLTGVCIGPNLIPPTRWLEEIIVDTESMSKAEYERFFNLITFMFNNIADARMGHQEFNVLVSESSTDQDKIRPVVWGFGLMKGLEVNLGEPFELDMLPNDAINAANYLLSPSINKMTISDIEEGKFPEQWLPPGLTLDEFKDNLAKTLEVDIDQYHQSLKTVSDVWVEGAPTTSAPKNRPIQQPVQVAPKVGRNDPCPCGSGKKYKKCCG